MVLIKGKPIVLVIVTTVFSAISLIMLLISFNWMYLFVAVSIFINIVSTIVFYLAYRRAEFAFMSPKKYKKAERIYNKNQQLYELIIKMEYSNDGLKPDNAIDKAIDILSKLPS